MMPSPPTTPSAPTPTSDSTDDERLDATFAALAHPTRRAILARLAAGEASVTEIARPFDATMPAISRHLRVLERAGLVTQGRRAQYRPCRLDPAPLREVADWTNQYRHVWEGRLDRLGEQLRSLAHDQPEGEPDD